MVGWSGGILGSVHSCRLEVRAGFCTLSPGRPAWKSWSLEDLELLCCLLSALVLVSLRWHGGGGGGGGERLIIVMVAGGEQSRERRQQSRAEESRASTTPASCLCSSWADALQTHCKPYSPGSHFSRSPPGFTCSHCLEDRLPFYFLFFW